jgi:hypothetical protein
LATTLLDVLKQMGVMLGILELRFTGVPDLLQCNSSGSAATEISCFLFCPMDHYCVYKSASLSISPKPAASSLLKNHTEITNKMQPCIRIYYSNIYQLLNMFRATRRSLSGAQNCKTRGCSYRF